MGSAHFSAFFEGWAEKMMARIELGPIGLTRVGS